MIRFLGDVLIGALGSLLAALIAWRLVLGKRWLTQLWHTPYGLAKVLQEGGITRFTLSRRDYNIRPGAGPLRAYLAIARHSIDMVSISMNVTQAEGSLISLFEQRINESSAFKVRITLLNPDSPVAELLAKSLDLAPVSLRNEIVDTLRQLWRCKQRLPPDRRAQLSILTHDTLPIGSAILLDAEPNHGRIQLETKLYKAPRTDSFGFEITGPSEFFTRSYEAWHKVFNDSTEYVPGSLQSSERLLFRDL